MKMRLLIGLCMTLLARSATAAPALYNCAFDSAFEKEAGLQAQKKPLVRDYIYDPVAGGGVIIGNDLDVLVVKGGEAISFVTKGNEGSVDSTTIYLKDQKDNKFPAVLSVHEICGALRPQQWYGVCTLSQRG